MVTPKSAPSGREQYLYDAIQSGVSGWQRRAYDDFFSLVRGLLIKSLGPHADIEDLTADVFVGFYESALNIRSAGGLRSYIVSVTMNTVRRELRRRKRRRLFFGENDDGLFERAPGTDDPQAKAALLQLSRILDELGEEERLTFVLHALEDLPLLEVAGALNISHSTAKRRYQRASERVRRRVEKNPLLTDYIRDKASQDKASQDKASQDKASQDKASQDKASRDRSAPETAGLPATGGGSGGGLSGVGQDNGGQNKAGRGETGGQDG
jgi:RNA polymerase sigma-70 factor (ECF subfamily)